MLTLIGIVIVVIGFVLRINPLLVVTVAGLATGIASGLGPLAVVAAFGKAFITSRYVAIVWLVLPAIGSILLIKGFLDQNGIHVEPTQLAIWAIPTAICAFVIHCTRLVLLDRRLRVELAKKPEQA